MVLFMLAVAVFLAALVYFIYSFVSWRKGLDTIQRAVENELIDKKEIFINDYSEESAAPEKYDASVMDFKNAEFIADVDKRRFEKELNQNTD